MLAVLVGMRWAMFPTIMWRFFLGHLLTTIPATITHFKDILAVRADNKSAGVLCSLVHGNQ